MNNKNTLYPERTWWKEGIIYQIYPRSFQDSDDDGIGDIQGIINRLDYLKDLGIDIIWLSPIYESPNDDNGYDISDYYSIMPEFGNMDDFECLLSEMHKRGLKLIMDLVVNHSSDEHPWFKEGRKSKNNPFYNYYMWREGKDDGVPNNWKSFFSGSAWEYNPPTDNYYLHLFSKKQPDLNWENPELREEIYKMMRYWLDKGVDGFRMDVITLISKDLGFPTLPPEHQEEIAYFYANGPRVHEFLQEMNREVLSKYDMLTVGEGIGVFKHQAPDYVRKDRKELQMIFHFDNVRLDRDPDNFNKVISWDLLRLKKNMGDWDAALKGEGWNSIYLGNHDWPRIVSRFGNVTDYWAPSAKTLATLLLTMRGTPYIYNGDEIGMTNCPFTDIDEYRDIQTMNAYQEAKKRGEDLKAFEESQLLISRDHSRTPIQWDTTGNAGFTKSEPWIKVNPNFRKINVEDQLKDKTSILNYYRDLIKLRKKYPALVYGDYEVIDEDNPSVYAYRRIGKEASFLVILSFSENPASFKIPEDLNASRSVIFNYSDSPEVRGSSVSLRPYEAVVFKID